MIQIKRVVCDIRGPDQDISEVELIINEELIKLQKSESGKLNKNIKIIDIKEMTKENSSILFFSIVYDNLSLNLDEDDVN